jgi:YHS domain-containing protein
MSDLDDFSVKLKAAFDSARERIHEIQEEAGREYEELQKRYEIYDRVVKHLGPTIARPRLEKLAEHFPGLDGTPAISRHGREVLLSFFKTPTALATIKLRLRMSHDAEIRNLVLEYDLEILPVYIDYERSSKLEIPLHEVTDEKVIAWLDERLLAFVKTYLSMEFSDQYQRQNLVVDPVAESQFPKTFAAGNVEYHGNTYYFLSTETMQAFQHQPELYTGSKGHK